MQRRLTFLLLPSLVAATPVRMPMPVVGTCAEAPAGLVGWWTFDSHGDLLDRAPHGSPVRVSGAVQWVDGRVGGGVEVGPGGHMVFDHPSGLELSEGFTVELWIRTVDSDGLREVVRTTSGEAGPGRGFVIRLDNGRPEVELESDPSTRVRAPVAVADGRWHHLAVSVVRAESAEVRFYIDGDPTPPRYAARAVGGIEGQKQAAPSPRAALDEISIYSRPLVRTEIVGIWAAGADGKCRDEDA